MAVDTFTATQFEAVLPRHKETGEPLWQIQSQSGPQDRELVYQIPVQGSVRIIIRSSINRQTGISADAGEDSIRVYVVDAMSKPVFGKFQAYITRAKGWDVRLLAMLKRNYKLAMMVGAQCPNCKPGRVVVRISRSEANPNRPFMTCSGSPDQLACGFFQ